MKYKDLVVELLINVNFLILEVEELKNDFKKIKEKDIENCDIGKNTIDRFFDCLPGI